METAPMKQVEQTMETNSKSHTPYGQNDHETFKNKNIIDSNLIFLFLISYL